MKKALKLAVIYLIILIFGTVLGTLLYSLYLNLLGFVSGREISFFSDEELFKSVFIVMPCMLIFIIPVISYYRIRHPGGILQLIVYMVLCLLTWALLMPLTFKLKDFCNRKFVTQTERQSLSPNYFRKVDDVVYFFTREFQNNTTGRVAEAPAIVIDTSEFGDVHFRTIGDYPNLDLNRKAAPYREIQLKNIFGNGEKSIPVDFKILLSFISGSYSGGLSHFLTLLSFALLICAVYSMTNFFDWRLLNAIIIFIVTALTLCVNSLYFMPQFADLIGRVTNNGFFRAFGNIVKEPLLFLINSFSALILILSGSIKFAVRKHAKKAN